MREIIGMVETMGSNPASQLIDEFEVWKASHYPGVEVDLDQDDNAVQVGQITSREPSKGNASACLSYLCALADRYRVVLIGAIYGGFPDQPAQPYGAVNPKLLAWYQRYGFEQMDEDEPGIWRYPK